MQSDEKIQAMNAHRRLPIISTYETHLFKQ